MGWNTFTQGLKIYFNKYKWGNTTLPDFIKSIQQGYDESNPYEPLDLTQWARDWIQTKGANKIKAEFTEEEGKITDFKIRQTPCKYADEVYRQQRFNIGLYDENGHLTDKITEFNLQAEEVTPVPQMIGKELSAAFLLNSDDWGFGYFELDEASVKVFEQSLSKVGDQLDRAVVIGQILSMMRQLAYPATRMPIIMNQLMDEDNQNLINALFGAFVLATQIYLPPETVPKFNKETADFFLRKAKKDKANEKLSMFCIDKAISFITEKDHLELVSQWINTGKITYGGEELNVQLTADQKYQIIKSYFASPHFTLEEKKALRTRALDGDASDNATIVTKVSDYSLPDPELKKQLWAEITDLSSKEPLKELNLKM